MPNGGARPKSKTNSIFGPMEQYKVKIDLFEGPFDLLLFFIERDELDIYDIPISEITNDFLSYIKDLERLNLDVASEFILMAATLMKVKSRSLIPRKQLDEDGNEIDPRKELVQRLLEYKQFKEIIEDFKGMEEGRQMIHERGDFGRELKQIANKAMVDIELESLSLYKLLSVFNQTMERFDDRKNRTRHEIVKWPYTIEDQSSYIAKRVRGGKRMTFQSLFDTLRDRIEAIVTFLALLEMLNQQEVQIVQGDGMNNFWIEEGEKFEEE